MAFSVGGARFGVVWHVGVEAEAYELMVWDTATGQELFHKEATPGIAFNGVAFSSDGLRVASAATTMDAAARAEPLRGGVRIWDVGTGKEVLSVEQASGALWGGTAFSPDGARIAAIASRLDEAPGTADSGTSALVWDAATGAVTLALTAPGGGRASGRSSYGVDVAFSPSGTSLAVAAGAWNEPGEVLVWNLEHQGAGAPRLRLRGHNGRVERVGFSPDGRRIYSAAVWRALEAGEVKLWDATTGQELLTVKARDFVAGSTTFSADGLRLLAARSSPREPGEQLEIWDGTPLPGGPETKALRSISSDD
jgi:WD40 repeat protein